MVPIDQVPLHCNVHYMCLDDIHEVFPLYSDREQNIFFSRGTVCCGGHFVNSHKEIHNF